MKRSTAGFLLALALIVAPSEGRATAFLSATVAGCFSGSCEFLPQVLGAGATTSILRTYEAMGSHLFQAEAGMTLFDYDSFVMFARGSGDAHPQGGTPGAAGIEAHGFARAIIRDGINVAGPAGSGTFRLVWHVTGVTAQSYTTTDPLQTGPLSEVQFGSLCGVTSGAVSRDCGTQIFRYFASTVVDETVTIDIPIVFNATNDYLIQFNLIASAGTGNIFTFPLLFAGQAIGNFGSSWTLVDVAVFDALGNALDESGIMAESLFRYDLVGQNVPEPLALALGAELVLAEFLRRRA